MAGEIIAGSSTIQKSLSSGSLPRRSLNMTPDKLPPAARLIADERRYTMGTTARGADGTKCGTGKLDRPVMFDCLGALFFAYRLISPEERHYYARMAFDLCQARHGHKRLGRLHWEEAFHLLKDAGV